MNTLRLLEMDALVVDTPDHRLTARGGPRRGRRTATAGIAAVVCTSGTTNAGIIDDLAGVGALARERGWWFHVDGAYGGSGIFARSLRPKYDGHRTGGLVHPGPAQVVVHAVRLLCADVSRSRNWHGPPTPRMRRTSTSSAPRRRVEPDGLRLPPDPAGPRAAAVVLAGGVLVWMPTARRSRRRVAGARDGSADQAAPQLELIREPDLGVVLFRRSAGRPRTTTRGRGGCTRPGRLHPADNGRVRRSGGSRSCTPTPAWTWSARC